MLSVNRTNRAFSIIELMVAILIICLLLSAVAFGINRSEQQSRNSKRVGDILLISQAIDQSVSLSRGIYPRDSAKVKSTMCVDEIDPQSLDLTIFSKRTIPQDDRPLSGTHNCATNSIKDGYSYTTRYGDSDNLAKNLEAAYTLEIGLEGSYNNEGLSVKTPTQLGVSGIAPDTESGSGGVRYRFILAGAYCSKSAPCYK